MVRDAARTPMPSSPDVATTGVRRKGGDGRAPAPVVLIVDDTAEDRELYASLLEARGLRVLQAADGERGVAEAVSSMPDIIVMDLQMPVLDGWKAMRLLKQHVETADVPIIAVTGETSAERVRAALEAGASELLTKPFRAEVLYSAVIAVLRRAAKTGA